MQIKDNKKIAKRQFTLPEKMIITVVILFFTIVAVGSYSVFNNKFWQKFQIDQAWSKDQTNIAKPLIIAIESYRERFGMYPASLDDLVPNFLAEIPPPTRHPSGNGGDKWVYQRSEKNGYLLYVTAFHWISSFDALVYRPSKHYPQGWYNEHYTLPVEDWLYIVGANKHVK